MEQWEAWLLIAVILGVIVSNIMVLKYTANYKMPQFGKPNLPKAKPKEEEEPEGGDQAQASADPDAKPSSNGDDDAGPAAKGQ